MHTVRHPPIRANTTSVAMPQSRPTYRRFLLPLLLAAAAIASLALDVPVGMKARRWNDPAVLERDASVKSLHDNLGWLDTFEPFGHGRGIVLVLLVLHQLDPKRRWAIPRLAACAGGGRDRQPAETDRCPNPPQRLAVRLHRLGLGDFRRLAAEAQHPKRPAELSFGPHRRCRRICGRLDLALSARPIAVHRCWRCWSVASGSLPGRTFPATCVRPARPAGLSRRRLLRVVSIGRLPAVVRLVWELRLARQRSIARCQRSLPLAASQCDTADTARPAHRDCRRDRATRRPSQVSLLAWPPTSPGRNGVGGSAGRY